MYREIENNDPSVGGALLWATTPANTMISSFEASEEDTKLQHLDFKLAKKLGVKSAQPKTSGDLWKAAREGNVEQLIFLLEEEKIPVNRTRWSGITAMHRAAEEGQVLAMQCLLDHGALIDMKASVGWYTPLHLACGRGHLEAGIILLRAGARWEVLDKHGRTPIDWAISGGYPNVARQLDALFRSMEQQKATLVAESLEEERALIEAENSSS
jgi:ankyrin repeat protein